MQECVCGLMGVHYAHGSWMTSVRCCSFGAINILTKFDFMCFVCISVHVLCGCLVTLHHLGLELQTALSCSVGLGIELRSPGRAASVLKHHFSLDIVSHWSGSHQVNSAGWPASPRELPCLGPRDSVSAALGTPCPPPQHCRYKPVQHV